MISLRVLFALILTLGVIPSQAATVKLTSFTAEVWADNWFALYVNGKKVGEDHIAITTQKSFNSEVIKFSATYPLTIGVIAKDYVQSQSGLEYLGTSNQQIGDGGIIFQIKESISGKLVAISDETWKIRVANTAPLNPDCEKSDQPDVDCKFSNFSIASNWAAPTFNDKLWSYAKVFSAAQVSPKEGYNQIIWNNYAKFIWGKNLKLDNTIYLRKKVAKLPSTFATTNFDFSVTSTTGSNLNIDATCDGNALSPGITFSAIPVGAKSLILIMDTIPGPARPGETQSGNHYYIAKFNISPTTTNFAEGAITPYSPPCSQGPGLKEYRFFLFALNKVLPSDQKLDGAALMQIGERDSIAKATHIFTYARKA